MDANNIVLRSGPKIELNGQEVGYTQRGRLYFAKDVKTIHFEFRMIEVTLENLSNILNCSLPTTENGTKRLVVDKFGPSKHFLRVFNYGPYCRDRTLFMKNAELAEDVFYEMNYSDVHSFSVHLVGNLEDEHFEFGIEDR